MWKSNADLHAYSSNITSAPEPAPAEVLVSKSKNSNISEETILFDEGKSESLQHELQKQDSSLEVLLSRLVPGPVQDDSTRILIF